jgi:diadenosine tetraphosphate (Ap4A) HIT family hydrolase
MIHNDLRGPGHRGGDSRRSDGDGVTDANEKCLFCALDDPELNNVLLRGEWGYVRWDNYPAAEGHVEIVPKRHVASYFDLTDAEAAETYALIKQAREVLDEKYRPAGYTIGVNEGRAAGRTVDHLHVHLIPRHEGDVRDPRGGIRHVLPGTDPDQWST